MREEVYQYLHHYGISAIELDRIEKANEGMFFTDLSEVRKNITFLEEKYLSSEDIIDIVTSNPFMLTEKNNRLEALDGIYLGDLAIDYESLIEMIKGNPEAYTVSPVELQKVIGYLRENNCNTEGIRNLVVKSPKVLSMKLDTFKNAVKFD